MQVILPHCSISTLTTTTEWMLSCVFAAPSGGHIEHYILDKDDGTYVVEYTPQQAGMYFNISDSVFVFVCRQLSSARACVGVCMCACLEACKHLYTLLLLF